MTVATAARVDKIISPAVTQVREKARRLEAEGLNLTYLMRGEPDFETPAHIRQAAIEALQAGQTQYPPVQGLPLLRQAVAGRMGRDFGLAIDPDAEVLITDGATMGIYTAIQAIIDSGDEVILFDPVYDPYPTVVRMAGGVPVQLSAAGHEGHFAVDSAAIEKAITGRSKAILLNTPWNPTGTVMTRQEMLALVDLAEAHNLALIVDEIYEKLTFDRHIHHNLASLSPAARARTITVNSFSKTYAMTGWRLGYTIAPPDLTQAMLKVGQQFSRSAATFTQLAGVTALNGPQDVVSQMQEVYAQRRTYLTDTLHQAGLSSFYPPEGTFFALLDVRPTGKTSQEMADYLLETARVVTIPASVYGPGGEGYVRLSFACSDEALRAGMEAVVKALQAL
jgi:aspartate/methionine/tyrosine aminotransferase